MNEEINYDESIEVVSAMVMGAKKETIQAIEIIKNAQYPKDIINVVDKLKTDVLPDIIKLVETYNTFAPTRLTGEQKKTLVVKIINKFVDIPVLWEAIEEDIIEIAIDSLIAGYNKVFGTNWLNHEDE